MISLEVLLEKENKIVFKGGVEVFKKPKYKLWLKNNFESIEFSENKIEVSNEKINEPQFIFQIKKSLLKRFSHVDLVFNNNFLEKIKSHDVAEENFLNFSNEAKKIWNNDFNSSQFQQYCNFLSINFPRKLYHRQLLSSYHLAFSQNSANFSVPGAGKTSIVYAAYCYLNKLDLANTKHVNKIVVIGPQASFDPWEDEFKMCFEKEVKSYRLNGENPKDERISFLKNKLSNDTELILITYESVPVLFDYLKSFFQYSENKIMLVCDEAHKIKNMEGERANCVLALSNFVNSRVVLTGTPCPNGPEDLFNLFKFLYPKRNVIKFRASALSSFNQPGNYSKLMQLVENIKPYFLRITKKDLNLPPVTLDEVINVNLSNFEQKIYNQIYSAMESSRSDFSRVSLHYRLIQSALNIHLLKNKSSIEELYGYYEEDPLFNLKKVLGDSLYHDIQGLDDNFIPAKHKEVLKKVLELKAKSQKVVIWGVYIDSIKRLNKLLVANGLKGDIIIGETKKGKGEEELENEITRGKILKKFKSFDYDSLDYIITNPVVLGESVSLHKYCHNSIYFELSYSAAPYVQSRDRIHRVWLENGKQKNYETNYFHIITSGSIRNIDQLVFSRVERKWKEMEKIIEHDIPLFSENINSEINSVITELINEYQKK